LLTSKNFHLLTNIRIEPGPGAPTCRDISPILQKACGNPELYANHTLQKNLTHDSSNHYCFYAVKKNPKVTHREKLNRISKLDEATANIGNISQTLIKINT
jgi:hypothetical protein